jgi:hypothetical protein
MKAPVIADYGYQNALTVKFTALGEIEPADALHTSSLTMPVELTNASTASPLYPAPFKDDCGVTTNVLELVTFGIAKAFETLQERVVIAVIGPAMVTLPSDSPNDAFPPGSASVSVRDAVGVVGEIENMFVGV